MVLVLTLPFVSTPIEQASLDILADHWCKEGTVIVDTSSDTTFYDWECNSANAVSVPPIAQRPQEHYWLYTSLFSVARERYRLYECLLICLTRYRVPSAVLAHAITKPAAAVTTKVTAKSLKAVTTTKTKEVVSTVTNRQTTFATTTLTGSYTRSITTTITNSQVVGQTNRLAATITEVKTYIVTNFDHLVYVYKKQFVTATNFNLVTTTSTRTIPNTRYNTVVVTRTQPTTVTSDVYTSSKTVLSTRTVFTGASTITGGTSTLYGTLSPF